METTRYAPIIVVTLNRNEHLKRCIHSLAMNTGAENTDIYISVDFPPAEKYIDGYRRVKEYLSSTTDLKKFKNAYIFYQEKNLGPGKNIRFLKE